MNSQLTSFFKDITLPKPESHKGQNGKLLIIGGSDLFHAASRWSLDVASKFVDMVFYSSVPSNNDLMNEVKAEFWNGIVVPRNEVESYLEEADCILIGPGMMRVVPTIEVPSDPQKIDWSDTYQVTNYLLKKYPHKKWVIDAGALQMLEPNLLTKTMIVTPHKGELLGLLGKVTSSNLEDLSDDELLGIYQKNFPSCCVWKGHQDHVIYSQQVVTVAGGNSGMTKGGTGDVLAGLIAALYCTQDILTSVVVGSYVNKHAGDALYTKVGPYFNASDLVSQIPETFWSLLEPLSK